MQNLKKILMNPWVYTPVIGILVIYFGNFLVTSNSGQIVEVQGSKEEIKSFSMSDLNKIITESNKLNYEYQKMDFFDEYNNIPVSGNGKFVDIEYVSTDIVVANIIIEKLDVKCNLNNVEGAKAKLFQKYSDINISGIFNRKIYFQQGYSFVIDNCILTI